jgi:hypothetical protein
MHSCTLAFGKIALMASGNHLRPSDAGDENVINPAILHVVKNLRPELRALACANPDTEDFLLPYWFTPRTMCATFEAIFPASRTLKCRPSRYTIGYTGESGRVCHSLTSGNTLSVIADTDGCDMSTEWTLFV